MTTIKHILFWSGGKDSTAMVEIKIKRKDKIDLIVTVSNEKDFKEEKEYRKRIIKRWRDMGYTVIVLKTEDTWDNWFFGKCKSGESKGLRRGFPLTAYPCWWTREAKVKVIEEYVKTIGPCIQYIGYTIDEKSDRRRKLIRNYINSGSKDGIYPLVDMQMTEQDCKSYCEERNILNPLYKYFNRLGCYLCPKQREESLKQLYLNFPEYWGEIRKYLELSNNDEFVKRGMFNLVLNINNIKKLEESFEKSEDQIEFNFNER